MEPLAGRWRLRLCVGAVMTATVAAFVGCAERLDNVDRSEEGLSQQERDANAALAAAESALEAEDLNGFNFRDMGQLDQLPELLPDPARLSTPESQVAVETAIGSFYDVLDIYAGAGAAAPVALGAPLQADEGDDEVVFSESDSMLVNVELGYLYVLDAVCRLQQAGGDLYTVESLQGDAAGVVYRFRLLRDIEGMSPQEVLALFSTEQRQALIDAVHLLVGAVVRAGDQGSDLDVSLFREDAAYHISVAAQTIVEVAPELEEAMAEFDRTVDDLFAMGIIDQLERWGFTIEELRQ